MKTACKKSFGCTIVIPLLLLTACQNEAETQQTANDVNVSDTSAVVVASDNNTDNVNADDAVLDNNTDSENENKSLSKADNSEFSAFNTVLQDSWKRVDYPNGNVEFANNQVKFTAGEGAAKAAKFEDFQVSDTCPKNIDAQASALAYDFLVIANKRCETVKISGNKLTLDYSGTSKGIEYERVGKTSAAAITALNIIPSNFHGKWADDKANCSSDNLSRITITANKIIFFENEAKLLKIKQFEPTRLEADFEYLKVEAAVDTPDNAVKPEPYLNTLDLQNNSKELVMRENGGQPIKSFKCE